MSSTGFNYQFFVEQDCDWTSPTFVYQDQNGNLISLVGYTAAAKIRTSPNGSGSNPGTVLLSLTSGSGITLGGAAATVVLALTHIQASLNAGTYWIDILLTSPTGVVTKFVSGPIVFGPTVTQ